MSMVTYPLNGIEYAAEDAELFHVTRTSGVYAENSFDYSVTGADNTIVIGTGIGWIKNSEFSGKVIAQKEPVSIDLGLPDSVYPRIDAVVIKFDANNNGTNIFVKNGVPSSRPVAPPVVRTESVYELHLYHILRNAGALAVSDSNITDLRLNPNYCGLMAESITNIGTDSENQRIEIHQLWENASPGSALTEQTLPINWEEYDILKIFCKGWYSSDSTEVVAKLGKESSVTSLATNENGSIVGFSRGFSIVDSGVFVSNCEGYSVNGKLIGNDRLMPQEIYGIKGINNNPELFTIGDLSGYTVNGTIEVNSAEEYLRGTSDGAHTTLAVRKTIFYNSGAKYKLSATFAAENINYTADPRLLLRCFDTNGNVITSGLTGDWIYNDYYNAHFLSRASSATFTLPSAVSNFQIGFVFETGTAGEYVRISNISLIAK